MNYFCNLLKLDLHFCVLTISGFRELRKLEVLGILGLIGFSGMLVKTSLL